eukprot:6624473-Pyramimonas_sp.AAC.1
MRGQDEGNVRPSGQQGGEVRPGLKNKGVSEETGLSWWRCQKSIHKEECCVRVSHQARGRWRQGSG